MSTIETHETAPARYVEANGIRYAYRSFGNAAGVPLVFFQRLRGTMDDWDPSLVNGLAKRRPVVLFDNTGVGPSGGKTPVKKQARRWNTWRAAPASAKASFAYKLC